MGNQKNLSTKIKIVNFIITAVLVVFVIVFISSTGSIKHLDEEVDNIVLQEENAAKKRVMVEGLFTDRNGLPITEGASPGKAATIIEPQLYSVLIGYNSQRYGYSGLRADKEIQSFIFNLNEEEDYLGNDVRLTVDTNLQRFCYELLGNNCGSIIVLDNATGDILAAVSKNSLETEYNANLIDEKFEEYSQVKGLFLNRCMLANDPPGSVGKLYTAAGLIENGYTNFVHADSGKYRGVDNAGSYHYGEVGITKAMVKSINTYYAAAADFLGKENMLGILESFGFNEVLPLGMGLGSLKSSVSITQEYELRQCGFGQGKLLVSPLHLALSLSCVVNDGSMLRPNIVLEVSKPPESDEEQAEVSKPESDVEQAEVLYAREVELMKENVISRKTADKLKQMLADTAESYKLKSPDGQTIYAKTGTAEISATEEGKYHIYLLFGTDAYCACISIDRTNEGSGYLKPLAQQLIDYMAKGGN